MSEVCGSRSLVASSVRPPEYLRTLRILGGLSIGYWSKCVRPLSVRSELRSGTARDIPRRLCQLWFFEGRDVLQLIPPRDQDAMCRVQQ